MTINIHLRGIDDKIALLLKNQAAQQDISVNSVILNFIKKGLGLRQERDSVIFHDLDKLAGTWDKKQAAQFMRSIADFEQIDKELWK